MRPLETLLFITLSLTLLEPQLSWPTKPRWLRFTALLAVIVALLHLGLEGERWQMLPVYLLVALLVVLNINRMRSATSQPSTQPTQRTYFGLALQLLLVALLAIPSILFPVPRLPALNGPYQVGTVSYDFTDSTRPELYTADPNDSREIMVQIWYPATPAPDAQTGPWMDRLDVVGPTIATYLNLPAFFLDHLALVRTNSYPEAPLATAEARYPVVIYSHGWNGFRTINTNQMEALASNGYIAVSIDHTYGAMVTVFSDGRVALNNPDALPSDAPAAVYQKASEILEATYAADVRFVMDQLEQLNQGELDGRFTGKFDLERIGLFGHSTGGGAIVLACSLDPRCKAGLGMDAWVVPLPQSVLPQSPAQPFMFMSSEVWGAEKNPPRLEEIYAGLPNTGYHLTIAGTRHYDFVMIPLLTPLAPALKLKGPLEGNRTLQIVTDYLIAFFDQQLKGQTRPLLNGPAPDYPEVQFESRQP